MPRPTVKKGTTKKATTKSRSTQTTRKTTKKSSTKASAKPSTRTTAKTKIAKTSIRKSTRIRPTIIEEQKRWMMIAEAAYLRAEKRGFAGGNEDEDWFQAEREVNKALMGQR